MSELQSIARLKIHPGKLDEFKRVAAKCMELVRTKDTGTLQYEMYINHDNTECLAFERYRDSQALLDHFENLGDTMAEFFQTCSGSGRCAARRALNSLSGSRIRRCRSTRHFNQLRLRADVLAGSCAQPPNNSFKPTPLRGAA